MKKISIIIAALAVSASAMAAPNKFDMEMGYDICNSERSRKLESWEKPQLKQNGGPFSFEQCVRYWTYAASKVGDYTGKYALDLSECTNPETDSVATFSKKRLEFYESSCRIDRVKDGALGKALIYDVRATCDSEGEVFKVRYYLDTDSMGTMVVTDVKDKSSRTYYLCER